MERKFFPLVFFLIFFLSSSIYAQTWTQVNAPGFGDANNIMACSMAVYNNDLYVGARNDSTGARVWRYDDPGWTQVNLDGFGDANNTRAPGMAVYNDRLYVGTRNDNTGAEVWEYDGSNWTQVNSGGLGDAHNTMARLAVYNNRLYVGTANGNTGAEVWEMYIPPSPIPTLSQWGMIIFSLLLAGTAIFVLRRRLYAG